MPRKKRSENVEARRFGMILAGILLVLSAFFAWRAHPLRAEIALGAAVAVAACTFLIFPLWIRFFRLWMKFAEVLAWLSTRILLSAFFYLLLTPYGLVARLLRKDPLDRAWKDGRPTYWIDKEPVETTIERYEKMF